MSFSPAPSSEPNAPVGSPVVAVQVPPGSLEQLSAEREACDSAERRATLLYEEGWLRGLLGDVDAAISAHTESAESVQHFVEPLFSALAVAEQRAPERIVEILAHLEGSLGSGEELTEALLYLALACMVHGDTSAAREFLDKAASHNVSQPAAWLLFELLAAQTHDEELRARAITMQAEATPNPDWKSLLHCEVAHISESLGQPEQALEALEAAANLGSEGAWAPLHALERWGILHTRPDVTQKALLGLSKLYSAQSESQASQLPLLPGEGPLQALYASLKMALLQRASDDPSRAQACFSEAAELNEGHAGLRALALADAGLGSDLEACTRHALAWLKLDPTDSEKAAAWLHVALSARLKDDVPSALAAARSAVIAAPHALLAPALLLQLHGQTRDAKPLAELHERLAQQATVDADRDRHIYRAAEVFARQLGDADRARELLQQGPASTAVERTRIERFLAATVADRQWFESAGVRLRALLPPGRQGSLHFEALRNAALGGRAVTVDESQPELDAEFSAWLAAYGPTAHLNPPEQIDRALRFIASRETDPERRHSQMLALALRHCLNGQPVSAAKALTEAEESGYREPVAALMLASLSQKQGQWSETAQALCQLALGTHDREHAAALLLQAGLCSWRANQQAVALSTFENAQELAPAPSLPLLAWGRRLHEPNSVEARQKALETEASEESRGLILLERFALAAQNPDGRALANDTLTRLLAEAPPELHSTSALAEALWVNATDASCSERCEAFERLLDWGEQATVIARSASYYARLADGGSGESSLRESAEEWVKCDPSVLPAIEWLWASQQCADEDSEAHAYRTLAARLHGTARSRFEATAATMQFLLGQGGTPELTGTDPESRLLGLELSPPGSDPRRRATALFHGAELLGTENQSLITALAGYNLLAVGELAAAQQAFQVAAAESPEDVFVWEGLRAVAEAGNNRGLLAEAYAGLGDSVMDDAQGALYWEKAATILLDELSEPMLGEHALSRSVTRDISRTRSFDRLFRIVREKKDHHRLLELIQARESATDEPDELAKLFWERARALRSLNRLPEALVALESVQMLEPDHVGALALGAEICMSQGEFSEAAEHLAGLAHQRTAPAEQRLMSGVAAVDIYENKLQDPAKALSVLLALYRSGLSTLPVRERLARAAAGAGAYEQALDVLEDLSRERETSEGRAEAARLCLVIARDKLQQPERATKAALRLLSELPADPEALDLVITGSSTDPDLIQQLADRSRAPLLQLVLTDPLDAGPLKLLDRLAECVGDAPLRQVTLGSLVSLGQGNREIDAELSRLEELVPTSPSMAINTQSVPDLLDPDDEGPLARLFHEAALSYGEILGPSLESFGVGKKQKVEPRLGLPIRNEIAAWAGALGLGEFDLYVGGEQPEAVRGIVADPPALIIGTSVLSPLSPAHRQAVARELFALKRGTSILCSREPSEIAALIAATGQVLGVNQDAPSYALTAEFVRLLGKGLSRKAKKALPPLLEEAHQSKMEPMRWVAAALSSMDRVAALAAGDVSWVLAKNPSMRGSRVASAEERERLRKLLSFVLAPRYLVLRRELGLGVQ